MRSTLLLIILFIISVVIDVAWFSLIANPYYIDAIGSMLRQSSGGFSLDMVSAIAVYALLMLGVILFVLPRAGKRPGKAAIWGAAYGLIVYGIYDFTNYATLADWPGNICFLDIGWGIVFCGIMSAIGAVLQKKLKC